MSSKYKLILISLFIILMAFTCVSAVEGKTYMVANTADWQSMYLTAMYASFTDANFVYLKNLGDAEIKTKLMSTDDTVLVFESQDTPVVKNYRSFLSINGFDSVGEYLFFNAYDLQEYLYDQLDSKQVFIFGNDFGMEPIALAPYLLKNNYFPMFYSKESTDFFYRISRRTPITVVGRVPVRTVDQLKPIYIGGQPQKTTSEVTSIVTSDIESDWGVITRIDSIDYDSIRADVPVFVFYSQTYTPQLADSISESGIKNFEVIGGNTADLAQELESQVGQNLNLMLKFGRKITNFEGLENSVLNIDAVVLPFPYEDVTLDAVNYYPDLGTFTLTLTNNGNIGVYSFSNIDYGGVVVSDAERHFILPGTTKTIPYDLSTTKTNGNATLTIRYGYAIPLQNTLQGDAGTPILQEKVDILTHSEAPEIEFSKADFNHKTGHLSIGYKVISNNPVLAQAEMSVNGEVHSSSQVTLSPGRSPAIPLDFPYVSNEDLVNKYFNITIYYGESDLLFTTTQEIFIEEQSNNVVLIAAVIVIVIAAIILSLLIRRKRKNASAKNMLVKAKKEDVKKKSDKKSAKKTTKKTTKKTNSKKSGKKTTKKANKKR